MNLLAIISCFVITTLNVFAQKQGYTLRIIRIISKALIVPSLLFIYFAFTKASYPLLVGALIAGWFGDLFLMVPGKKPDTLNEPMFIAGLLSFLAGHVLYIMLFFQNSVGIENIDPLLLLPYLPYLLLSVFMLAVLNLEKKLILGGVALYTLILTFMSYSALIRLILTPTIGPLFCFIGSLLFTLSDLVLALKELGNQKHLPGEIIMGTYIVAQLFILMGFLL